VLGRRTGGRKKDEKVVTTFLEPDIVIKTRLTLTWD